MRLWEKIKCVETFLSLGLLTRHHVNSQNWHLSACNNTGKSNTQIPISVTHCSAAGNGVCWEVCMCCTTHCTAEPQISEQGKTELPTGSSALCIEQGQAWLDTGLWTQAGAGPGQRGGTHREQGLYQSCTASVGAPVCHHSGISKHVQTLCVYWESHWFEVNLLMQQNTLFLKGQQVKLCWNINLITWAVGMNGH